MMCGLSRLEAASSSDSRKASWASISDVVCSGRCRTALFITMKLTPRCWKA